jgi:hypothetical protein
VSVVPTAAASVTTEFAVRAFSIADFVATFEAKRMVVVLCFHHFLCRWSKMAFFFRLGQKVKKNEQEFSFFRFFSKKEKV